VRNKDDNEQESTQKDGSKKEKGKDEAEKGKDEAAKGGDLQESLESTSGRMRYSGTA
jgi:hypothetical protein